LGVLYFFSFVKEKNVFFWGGFKWKCGEYLFDEMPKKIIFYSNVLKQIKTHEPTKFVNVP